MLHPPSVTCCSSSLCAAAAATIAGEAPSNNMAHLVASPPLQPTTFLDVPFAGDGGVGVEPTKIKLHCAPRDDGKAKEGRGRNAVPIGQSSTSGSDCFYSSTLRVSRGAVVFVDCVQMPPPNKLLINSARIWSFILNSTSRSMS